MMQDLIVAGTVKLADLSTFVQPWKDLKAAFMLLENMPQRKVEPDKRQNLLRFELFQPDLDFTPYKSGRIFHEFRELRLDGLSSDEVQVVYTGTPESRLVLPENQPSRRNSKDCTRVARYYFQFGKRLEEDDLARIGPAAQEGDYAEVRSPRLLRYPRLDALKGAERVQLALYEYVDHDTGATIAYRFRNLVPFQKERTPEMEEGTLA